MEPKLAAYLIQTGTRLASDGIRIAVSQSLRQKARERLESPIPPEVALTGETDHNHTPMPEEVATPKGAEADSYAYQLDMLADDLDALATEHLPNQGKIQGKICDCLAKHGRELRRHARETIPIASREGKDAAIYSEMVATGDRLIEIGTPAAVKTGLYDAEYLRLAGVASNYYKQVDKMRRERQKQGGCQEPECQEVSQLWQKVQGGAK